MAGLIGGRPSPWAPPKSFPARSVFFQLIRLPPPHSLPHSYLFPEAPVLTCPGSSFVAMEAALSCCCSAPGCRLAATDLLVDLMTPSADAMEAGCALLTQMHFMTPFTLSK